MRDSLVKNLGKNELYHLSQEFKTNVSDLIKKKGFFQYDYTFFFKLELAYYISTPGYSWNAILRFKGVKVKPISDIERW